MDVLEKTEKNNILIELRKSTKMNRREFAAYFGIPYPTITDWELGKRHMPDYLLRLIEYRVHTDDMLKLSGQEASGSSVSSTAYLSNDGSIISFSFRDKCIRFRGPASLVKFDKVVSWDNGYIVVEAFYSHSKSPIEDYIDLVPVMNQLYMDSDSVIPQIKKVEVRYA